MTRLLAAVLCACSLGLAQDAAASHENTPMTEESALLAADRMWPGHACEGRVDVIYGPTTPRPGQPDPDGEATGIEFYWNGTEYQWVRTSCAITVRPGLSATRRCRIIVHEVGHLAMGPEHTADTSIMDAGGGYATVPGCQEVIVGHRSEPITERQLRYRQGRHAFYHERSEHPERKSLAVKWHRLAEAGA